MTTWVDTNVLVALWSGDAEARVEARKAMKEAAEDGWFAVGACVYAEFLAGPGRETGAVRRFLDDAEIPIGWQTGEDVWLLAAEGFAAYAKRRRENGSEQKRFLADFLIGAQATLRGGRLITFDQRIYASTFPGLKLFGRAVEAPPF
jgi:predicted nucleic acid-binding protein